jgi:hypothetical protein
VRPLHRIVLLAILVAITPALAGCADGEIDLDKLDVFGLNNKKPLPGKREDLFPNGVPGVTQGIPPEYMKGYQEKQQQESAAAAAKAAEAEKEKAAAAEKAKAAAAARAAVAKKRRHVVKRKAKPKPVVRALSKPAAQQAQQAPWPTNPPAQKNQAPWPSNTSSQANQAGWPSGQTQQQQSAPWPSAPPPGTFSR